MESLPVVNQMYRLFSEYSLLLNTYTSPGVYDSLIEHWILTKPTEVMEATVHHAQLFSNAFVGSHTTHSSTMLYLLPRSEKAIRRVVANSC